MQAFAQNFLAFYRIIAVAIHIWHLYKRIWNFDLLKLDCIDFNTSFLSLLIHNRMKRYGYGLGKWRRIEQE